MDFKIKETNASILKRIIAFVIDFFIISFILLPFKGFYDSIDFLKEGINIETINQFRIIAPKFIFVSLVVGLLTISYWAILEYYTKQSLGKMIFKIRVISTKGKLRFWQCFLRNVSKSSIILLVIDFIFLLFSKEKQRLFEKISHTKVVEWGLDI